MKKKIKSFIAKIKTSVRRSMCYNDMESVGIAVFGMCSGGASEHYRKDNCYDCPYFRDIRVTTTPNDMTLMDAWRIIQANLLDLYKRRKDGSYKGYTDADTEAEIICFRVLREMEGRNRVE